MEILDEQNNRTRQGLEIFEIPTQVSDYGYGGSNGHEIMDKGYELQPETSTETITYPEQINDQRLKEETYHVNGYRYDITGQELTLFEDSRNEQFHYSQPMNCFNQRIPVTSSVVPFPVGVQPPFPQDLHGCSIPGPDMQSPQMHCHDIARCPSTANMSAPFPLGPTMISSSHPSSTIKGIKTQLLTKLYINGKLNPKQ